MLRRHTPGNFDLNALRSYYFFQEYHLNKRKGRPLFYPAGEHMIVGSSGIQNPSLAYMPMCVFCVLVAIYEPSFVFLVLCDSVSTQTDCWTCMCAVVVRTRHAMLRTAKPKR